MYNRSARWGIHLDFCKQPVMMVCIGWRVQLTWMMCNWARVWALHDVIGFVAVHDSRGQLATLCVCVRDITGRFRLAPWHTTPWRHALTLGCTSIRLLAKLRAYTISGNFLWLCLLDNFACIENAWQRCWHWRRDSLKRMTVRQRHEPCDCPNTIIYSCFFF